MGFFDHELPTPDPKPAAPATPNWVKPEDVLPGVAPVELVLAHTGRVAIAISALEAYPTGFSFRLSVVLRVAERRRQVMGHPAMRHGSDDDEGVTPEFLRVGVRYPDGRTATNLAGLPPFDRDPDGPILFPGSGGGGGRHWDATFWVWPRPTPGTFTFVCEWPAFDVPETSVELDAAEILAAADRSVTLWSA